MHKLRLTLLLILGLFGISIACEDILRECAVALGSEVQTLTGLPSEEELRKICPVLLEFFVCVREKSLKCEGKSPEEAAITAGVDIDIEDAEAARLFLSVESIAKDLCNEESSLHRSYIRTQPCTREYFSEPKLHCKREAEAAYATYRELTEDLPGESDENHENAMCLMEAYALACVAHDLQVTCSEEARNIFTGIFQRLKVGKFMCSVSSLEELKTNFLESLDMEPERKDVFALAFNVLKKRKK